MTVNPLQDGLRIEPAPGPSTLVIFGASGDLTRRKLLPALRRLSEQHRLPPHFSVIGVARTPLDDERFQSFLTGEFDDAALYTRLAEQVRELGDHHGVLFYLAIPPSAYGTVVTRLGAAGLTAEASPAAWRRIIVEKPFGRDLETARALNALLHEHFHEHQVFRIDHYLGKETVQNLLVFRFANGMFEPIWNRRYIDHVQITAAETVGVEQRAGYYDSAGALRDMVQNHLLQLLTLVAMEPPTAFTAESVRDRKMDALLSVQPIADVVRGQYAGGWVAGKEVPPYSGEPGVPAGSRTETYVALKVALDSWRWAGVPFYLRTGKRLPKRTTEIAIQFKRPPLEIFRRVSPTPVAPSLLIVNVQPDEGISLRFEAKLPGTRMQLAPVMMHFRYSTTFGGEVPEAYETLLLDALLGDSTLFARHDFAETAWALISSVHQAWDADDGKVPLYEAGEWGPREADALLAADGRRWRTL